MVMQWVHGRDNYSTLSLARAHMASRNRCVALMQLQYYKRWYLRETRMSLATRFLRSHEKESIRLWC